MKTKKSNDRISGLRAIVAGLLLWTMPSAIAQENGGSAEPAPVSVEDQLKALTLPENTIPGAVSEERMYAVQTRYVPLKYKHELGLVGLHNFSGDSFIKTNDLGLTYRFHFSNRVSLNLQWTTVYNTLSDAGNRLYGELGRVPDITYAKWRADATIAYNTFYGKFRFGMEQAFYFDQYFALGGGVVQLPTGNVNAVIAEAGFAFWLGRRGSLRLALRDSYYKETRLLSESSNHNIMGFVGIGYLLGGDHL